MESKKISNVEHIVFESREEFERHFMHKDGAVPELIEDWREGKEKDWVLADDGGVVQILRQKQLPHPHDRKNYKNNGGGWCRTVVGTFVQNEKFDMDTNFDLHPNRYTFSQKTAEEVKYNARRRENPTKREKIFSVALATGKTLQSAYEEAYGPSNNWREKALDLVKRETVMKEVRASVDDVLKDLGVDLTAIFSEMWDLARQSDDDSVKFRALKELKETLLPKEVRRSSITGTERFGFSGFAGDKKLEEIEAQRSEVAHELSEVREIDADEDSELVSEQA
jgi:hypothetical protein